LIKCVGKFIHNLHVFHLGTLELVFSSLVLIVGVIGFRRGWVELSLRFFLQQIKLV